MSKTNTRAARERRHVRVRLKISGTEERPRLAVFRSLNNIYAQIIDDSKGSTLASASTLDTEAKDKKNKTESATAAGLLLAERAKGKGISQVTFDRGGFRYHGRVKALAEAARKGGLKF
jgi:large subunit ribosomal protein L18